MPVKKLSFADAVSEIKKIFGFQDMPSAPTTVAADALKDYTTDAGIKIKIDNLAPGGKAYAEDGITPLTMGVTLSDGTIVAIGMDGTITAVTAPVATPPPPPITDPNMPTDTPAMLAMRAIKEKFAAGTSDDRIANLETMCGALMEYAFGWKIDESTRQALQDQAISAFKTLSVPQLFAEQFGAEKAARIAAEQKTEASMKLVVDVLQQFAEAPGDDPAQAPGDRGPAPTKLEAAAAMLQTIQKKPAKA